MLIGASAATVDGEAADGDLVAREARSTARRRPARVHRTRAPSTLARVRISNAPAGTELNRHAAAIGQPHLHGKRLTRHRRRHGRRRRKWSAASTASATRRRRAARLGKGGEIQPKRGRDRVLELPLLDAEHEERLGLARNARHDVACQAQSFREPRHGR